MLLSLVAGLTALTLPPRDTTVRISRGTVVIVETATTSVRLEGTSGDVVTVTNGTARLRGGRLEVESTGRGMLRVTVPQWAATSVDALTGSIEVTNAPVELELDGIAGAVGVSGGAGRLTISAAAGNVVLSDYEGRVEVEAIAGPISVRDASGVFHLEAVNSSIRMERVRSASVEATSTNGAITWVGPVPTDARYTFESHNGDIEVAVPPGLDARLRVRTFLGSFDTAIPARTSGARERSVAPWEGERELVATYGSGAATINISTFNGSVRVRPLGGS